MPHFGFYEPLKVDFVCLFVVIVLFCVCVGGGGVGERWWLLCFGCLYDVLLLLVFCGSSSVCLGWSAVCDYGIS